MTKEEKKEILSEYQKYLKILKAIDTEIEELKTDSDNHQFEIKSLIRRKKKFERIVWAKKELTFGYIDTVLSVKHNRLLVEHYIYGIPWTKIEIPEIDAYMTERQIFRIASEAIDMIEDQPAYTSLDVCRKNSSEPF